ncbi:MAG: hypothetical protein ACI9F9_000159 [Candidatus Paceibacteria bacterium]|jgi:hypothetical protein
MILPFARPVCPRRPSLVLLVSLALLGAACKAPAPASTAPRETPTDEQRQVEIARRAEQNRTDLMATQGATSTTRRLARGDAPDIELEKKTRELYVAELELALAEGQADNAEAKAQDDLTTAEHKLETAEAALAHYTKSAAPRLLADQKLKADNKAFAVEEAQQNLDQMKEEYGKFETDSPAKRTGQIVIWRSETRLGLAKRSLAGASSLHKDMMAAQIPTKMRELTEVILSCTQNLRKSKEAIGELAVKNKIALTRAGNKKVFLELELELLRMKQGSN